MPGMPESVRVRLSSEEAGSISLTRVVVRDLPVRELVEHLLAFTGKDEARVRELLLRGSMVVGASRFRWQGWDPGAEDVRAMLGTFPDSEPGRPFVPERCRRAVLRGTRAVEITREAGERKTLFRRASFWDVLMDVAAGGTPRYLDYCYRERADRYQLALTPAALDVLRDAAGLVAFSTLRDRVRTGSFETVELFVARE